MSYMTGLEAQCDAQVKAVTDELTALMVANGKNKYDILKASLEGPVDPKVPASILQLHPDVTVIYSEV